MLDWVNELKKKLGEVLPVTVMVIFIFLISTVFYISNGSACELKAERPESSKVVARIPGPNDKAIHLTVDSDAIQIAKEQLRGDFFEKSMECYQKVIEYFQWFIGILIALVALGVAVLGLYQKGRIEKTGDKQEERLIDKAKLFDEISVEWNEASLAYSSGKYDIAAEKWKEIYIKYKRENRPFYNNWGSSLLNWAGTIEKGEKQKQLANEAIEKYLKAEEFKKGIAAYKIACCYAILDNSEKCKEWLETAKQTGRLLSWERASTDRDLKRYAEDPWFKEIWGR